MLPGSSWAISHKLLRLLHKLRQSEMLSRGRFRKACMAKTSHGSGPWRNGPAGATMLRLSRLQAGMLQHYVGSKIGLQGSQGIPDWLGFATRPGHLSLPSIAYFVWELVESVRIRRQKAAPSDKLSSHCWIEFAKVCSNLAVCNMMRAGFWYLLSWWAWYQNHRSSNST